MANSWQQPNDAEPGGGQWHKIADPGTGWLASKTASWTADRFTTASGGMAVDFSSVVPVGTKAVKAVVFQATPSYVSRRSAGDTEISNTPNASSEWNAIVMAGTDVSRESDLFLSTDYRVELAVTNVATDVSVSYPSAYML